MVLAPFLLLVVQGLTAAIVLPHITPPPEGGMGLAVVATAVTALLLAALALGMTIQGPYRVAALWLAAGAIPLNNLVEAFFFPLQIPRAELGALAVHEAVSAALFAAILHLLAGPPAAPETGQPGAPRSLASWAARIVALDVLFVVLYLVAGLMVWPFVRHFYEGRQMPSPPLIFVLQIARGLVFTAIAAVLARSLRGPRVPNAVAVGLAFALLGGVLPLLAPNPYMPASIRWPHMVEVGVSYVIFGFVAAWLTRRSATP
jgi:hypothetical protein